jgi:hypothetical protein
MVRDHIERLSHRRLRSLSSLTSGKMLSATSPEALPRKLLPISHRSSFVETNTELGTPFSAEPISAGDVALGQSR